MPLVTLIRATAARRLAVAGALSLSLLAVARCAPVDAASLAGGAPSFGAEPVQLAGSAPRSYFSISASPGSTVRDALELSNATSAALALKIGVQRAGTAIGAGYMFLGGYGRCAGVACWLSGLPREVTLAAHHRLVVPFVVHVPAALRNGQYLAGIAVEPAVLPRPTVVARRGAASAAAIIVHQVVLGVAVTVGPLSSLTTRLAVPKLTAGLLGGSPRLWVEELNSGQTFAHARGLVSCASGRGELRYPFVSGVVVPATSTEVPVNAPGLAVGSPLRCRVALVVSGPAGTLAASSRASWAGTIELSSAGPGKVVQVGPGHYVQLPAKSTTPAWLAPLLGVGSAIVVLLAALVVLMLVRRRRAPAFRPEVATIPVAQD